MMFPRFPRRWSQRVSHRPKYLYLERAPVHAPTRGMHLEVTSAEDDASREGPMPRRGERLKSE